MQFLRRFFGGFAIIACLALNVFGSPSALAQSPSQAIVVEGNHRVDADTVRSYFKRTDPTSVDLGVKDLSASRLFSIVSARIVSGKVVVKVVESDIIINRVAFEGNSKIKGDQLAVEVQSKARSGYSESVAQGDVDRIKEVYRRTGRGLARVSKRLVQLPSGKYDLVFTIDEGEKTGVKAINFVGNARYSAYRLHGLMATTEMNFLSFIKTSDVYDADKLASDEEAIRKYYMKNGFADFRITNSDVHFDAQQGGYIITITMAEGPQYRVSSVRVDSHIPKVDGDALLKFVKLSAGDIYDASAVELSTEGLTRDVARQGYAFSQVRPHGERDDAKHTIALVFTVDDGPKVYIERIDVVGNTRTRDYVIRRGFDIGEGDPYNHALIERAERRLNNLGFFKKVHITNRPGSSPDRVIVVVEVEDQPTGAFSISGGYSTVDGALAEVSVTETNFLGRGQYVKLSVSYGQYTRGWSASFTEPYLFDQHMAGGIDIYHKATYQNEYAYYETWTTGATLRLGLPINDNFTFQPHYSIYESQITIPNSSSYPYDDCTDPITGVTPGTSGASSVGSSDNCLTNGEASLALKEAAKQGAVLTSLFGYSLVYNTLDNSKNPSQGLYANFKQDIAGAGGQSRFLRETLDTRYYYPLSDDFTGLLRLQAGNIFGFGGSTSLQITNNFNLGQSLVRGFASLGPRDISDPNSIAANGLGGTTYFGGSAEVQFPIFGVPKEIGLKGAVFMDAGTLFGFQSQTNFANGGVCTKTDVAPTYTQGNCIDLDDEKVIRSSVGAGLIWASPLGPIRIDYAYAITKGKYDQIQQFNFSGGTTF